MSDCDKSRDEERVYLAGCSEIYRLIAGERKQYDSHVSVCKQLDSPWGRVLWTGAATGLQVLCMIMIKLGQLHKYLCAIGKFHVNRFRQLHTRADIHSLGGAYWRVECAWLNFIWRIIFFGLHRWHLFYGQTVLGASRRTVDWKSVRRILLWQRIPLYFRPNLCPGHTQFCRHGNTWFRVVSLANAWQYGPFHGIWLAHM